MIRRVLARLMGVDPRECEEVRTMLSDHLDGTLVGAEDERVKTHVGRCRRCRRALENLRFTLSGLRRLGTTTTDELAAAERVRRNWRPPTD